jgi:hypothetical protein
MPLVRDDAISQLTALLTDPAEKLELSDQYDVPSWSIPALTQLVNRPAALSEADVVKIGLSRGLKVAAMREGNLQDQLKQVPKVCQKKCACGSVVTCTPVFPSAVQSTEAQVRARFRL